MTATINTKDLIKQYNLKFVRETRWNIVYDGDVCTVIFNKEQRYYKLKPKY